MNTENLNDAQCEVKKPRRKTLAIVTSGMAHTLRAEMLSHFTSKLVERGWDITIITNNRQDYFDFLIEDQVKRFSMDSSFRTSEERKEIFAKFIEEHPEIDQYLFWEVRMKTFVSNFDTVRQMGKAAFIVFWDSLNEIATYSTKKRATLMERIAASDATVSSFPLDHFIDDVTYIPYLYPYAAGDLSKAELGEKELLLLSSGSSARTLAVVQKFADLVKTEKLFRDKTLRIVPINKKLAKKDIAYLEEIIEELPKNIILEELCEKPHKILDGNAGVIIVDNNQEHPKMLSVAVAKGMPTLLVKGYADYSVQEFNKGFRICHSNNAEKLADELRRFFNPKVNAKRAAATLRAVGKTMKNELLDCWENVLLGNPVKEFQFVTNEHVLLCCLSYLKNQKQKLLQRYEKAARYNGDPIVKRAKKKVAKLKKKDSWSLTKFFRTIQKKYQELLLKFHYWDNNRRFNFSFMAFGNLVCLRVYGA